jgi:hypothetical protein
MPLVVLYIYIVYSGYTLRSKYRMSVGKLQGMHELQALGAEGE